MRRDGCGSARPPITRLDTSTSLEGRSARADSSAASTFSSRPDASSLEGAQPERAGSFCGCPTLCDFQRVGVLIQRRPGTKVWSPKNPHPCKNREDGAPTGSKSQIQPHEFKISISTFLQARAAAAWRDICLLRRGYTFSALPSKIFRLSSALSQETPST